MNKKYLIATLLFVLLSVSCSISDSSGNGGQDSVSDNTIATVENIYVWIEFFSNINYKICVELKPTTATSASEVYIVDLYEYNKYRSSSTMQWNQPQINVQTPLQVFFPATEAEYDAYIGQDISRIFSIKVH